MFPVLGPLIRLGLSSRTSSRTSALRHRLFPKSQAPSSRRAPVLPVPLSTLAPSIVGTRSLIGTNEGLTPPGHFEIPTVPVGYATHSPTLKVRPPQTPTTATWPKFFQQEPQPPPPTPSPTTHQHVDNRCHHLDPPHHARSCAQCPAAGDASLDGRGPDNPGEYPQPNRPAR